MARVVLSQLQKTYPAAGKQPAFTAVQGIDLEVRDGEFMVLVGPSGCGKSTTLRMIAGLEEISGGTIAIDDRVVNHVLPKDRDIAMVFQNYALYPHMSVYENMAFGLRLRHVPREEIERRVQEAAALLGLSELLARQPRALSGGQRQRVALGRAIVRQPKVFLFDEPLSNLDAQMRVAMRAEISRLHARLGATMIYVTHDQVEAMTMGDRICVMNRGAIVQVAEPLELYRCPRTLFAAGFIGAPAMNFFRGTITADGRFDPLGLQLAGARPSGAVVLGLRAEDFVEIPAAEPGRSLAARVDIVEPLGAETFLHLTAGPASFVARVGPERRHAVGETVHLRCQLERAHLFDPATGERL